jgi:formylmethanofuran dehydrogenase subunit E
MKAVRLWAIVSLVLTVGIISVFAYATYSAESHREPPVLSHSHDGDAWNQGQAPEDWWGEIKRMHGHVGPWNVLGWRIGQAALREFDTQWGRHDLEIICYVPMQTPYTCMADGLVIGTGNCLGRLDIRLAEVMSMDLTHVAVRRNDGTGPVLIFKPRPEYLLHICKPKAHELEELSRKCAAAEESELFKIERLKPALVE